MNRFSQVITQPRIKGAAQSMLYALGLTPKDMNKAQIGIGTVYYDSNPCNAKLNILSKKIQNSINSYNDKMIGFKYNTIGVSDGISMGTSGMNYSLPSRELIADSIETITGAHHYDGLICVPGCDKNIPACLMALLRLDRPGFIIYGGSMQPSYYNNSKLDIVSSFESYGLLLKNMISENEYDDIIQNACHGDCGSCAGLYTANTMAAILEVMGITLPNSSSNPSLSIEKYKECENSGAIMNHLLKNNITPRKIITKESFNNAIKLTYLLGGSTNAVIHLLAIAKQCNIDLKLTDFNNFAEIPVMTNMKPHGEYVMHDLHKNGGMTSLLKYFIDEGYINGDLPTINGNTLIENINKMYYDENVTKIIKNMKETSHIKILYGTLAPNGCVVKVYNENIQPYYNSICVYDSESEFITDLKNGEISNNRAILIRYQGESVGCPEMLNATSALIGYFGEENVPPLLTDGRFSGGSRGILVAHLPDANKKDSITRYLKTGDMLYININEKKLEVFLQENIEKRELEVNNSNNNDVMIKSDMSNSYIKKYGKLASNIKYGYST